MSSGGFRRPFLPSRSSVAAEQLTCVCFTAHDEKPEAAPVSLLQCTKRTSEANRGSGEGPKATKQTASDTRGSQIQTLRGSVLLFCRQGRRPRLTEDGRAGRTRRGDAEERRSCLRLQEFVIFLRPPTFRGENVLSVGDTWPGRSGERPASP